MQLPSLASSERSLEKSVMKFLYQKGLNWARFWRDWREWRKCCAMFSGCCILAIERKTYDKDRYDVQKAVQIR